MIQRSSKTWQILAGNQEMLRMSIFRIHQQCGYGSDLQKVLFPCENFPTGYIIKNINLQPAPKESRYPLLKSLWDAPNFSSLYWSQRGVHSSGCSSLGVDPSHRDAKNFFPHQLQAWSHRHALRQCLSGNNQRRPAELQQDHSVQDKPDVSDFIILGTKNYDGFWNERIVFRILRCPSFGKDYCHFAYN